MNSLYSASSLNNGLLYAYVDWLENSTNLLIASSTFTISDVQKAVPSAT